MGDGRWDETRVLMGDLGLGPGVRAGQANGGYVFTVCVDVLRKVRGNIRDVVSVGSSR